MKNDDDETYVELFRRICGAVGAKTGSTCQVVSAHDVEQQNGEEACAVQSEAPIKEGALSLSALHSWFMEHLGSSLGEEGVAKEPPW